MTFGDVVRECANNPELVDQFDRLTGSNLSRAGGPLALAIDDATGRTDADAARFLDFVWDCVWTRMEAA